MTIDIAKLRAETLALIDGTTPGPWQPYGQSIKANGWCDTFNGTVLADVARAHDTEQADYEGRVWGVAGRPEANARLIAAAPTLAADTLRLLDEIERLTVENERLRTALKRIEGKDTYIGATINSGVPISRKTIRGELAQIARAALAEGDPA